MKGRKALITGSSRGIGRATALHLAERGAAVAVNFRTTEDAAREVVRDIESQGGTAVAIRADVTNPDSAAELVKSAAAELGGLDILVNNVGEFYVKHILDEDVDSWRRMFDSNLHSAFYCCRAAIPHLRRGEHPRIVNIALAPAERLRAAPQTTAYTIAKMGLLVLTKTLAFALAEDGICVNAVSPGLINTGGFSEKVLIEMAQTVPVKRMGEPGEIARIVTFLCEPESSYITGANIQVSGGWQL